MISIVDVHRRLYLLQCDPVDQQQKQFYTRINIILFSLFYIKVVILFFFNNTLYYYCNYHSMSLFYYNHYNSVYVPILYVYGV